MSTKQNEEKGSITHKHQSKSILNLLSSHTCVCVCIFDCVVSHLLCVSSWAVPNLRGVPPGLLLLCRLVVAGHHSVRAAQRTGDSTFLHRLCDYIWPSGTLHLGGYFLKKTYSETSAITKPRGDGGVCGGGGRGVSWPYWERCLNV